MATYQYRCAGCGPFDVTRPIGQARPEEPCEACGHPSRRLFTSPMVIRTPAALARALQAQEASAYEPRVVDEVPASRRAPARSADPRHALLPKP
ncbi:putative FmdB family regulatory protein [Nonomuraea polychroma]|uniref:Putative FmdB family regulatory protein n=1 Tax=Nonomuraea polychroma TaxID=46176 RepID=A0A438LZM2_9ACTN|nr:FmdB family zinc ribbon protein [Nonomuraea polychroma]RVX39024.1 putative FmdB family regulatory protein [Nonomuraea polychroma]